MWLTYDLQTLLWEVCMDSAKVLNQSLFCVCLCYLKVDYIHRTAFEYKKHSCFDQTKLDALLLLAVKSNLALMNTLFKDFSTKIIKYYEKHY